MTKTFSRHVVTPVTIVLFIVSTVTGVMLLARWYAGLVRFSHEWLSVAFSVIAMWHLVRNWGAFTQYLRRNMALAAFAVSLVVSVVLTGMTGTTAPSGGPGAVFRAMSGATLETAAPALGVAPPAAVAILKAANIDAQAGETLDAIGKRAGIGAPGVLSLLVTSRGR
ncbi:DUF4405 domain-containing protein [Azospirillum sp. sgz301742]